MGKLRDYILFCTLIAALASCRKPYNPPAIKSTVGYLVVEGIINAGNDSTIFKLSRAVSLSNKNTVNPEAGATLAIESDKGVAYALIETMPGIYVAPPLGLDQSRQYRLRIKTAVNETYLSDFVPVVITPAIDSIGFNVVNDPVAGIEIYANAHDLTGNAKYFRWDYEETWLFRSKFISYYISTGSDLAIRTYQQDISSCFASAASSDIVLYSSAKLRQDVLNEAPIAFIASTSEKIEAEYSILLRQYAVTGDAYDFWTNLKTNSEQLGSIFDAQPSQLSSNIHNLSNQNSVIGYISACTSASKRIIITKDKLPAWITTYPYECNQDSVKYKSYDYYNDLVDNPGTLLATGPPPTGGGIPAVIAFSTVPCVDCTIRGTTTVPSFFQ